MRAASQKTQGKKERVASLVVLIALVLTALCSTSQAEEKHSDTARLQIQVNVMPTVTAQQLPGVATPPSHDPVTYLLKSESGNRGMYSVRDLPLSGRGLTQTAVLKTMTIVAE